MPRFLTPDEVSLVHRLLPETTELSERLLKDLALAQVEDVEVVGFGGRGVPVQHYPGLRK